MFMRDSKTKGGSFSPPLRNPSNFFSPPTSCSCRPTSLFLSFCLPPSVSSSFGKRCSRASFFYPPFPLRIRVSSFFLEIRTNPFFPRCCGEILVSSPFVFPPYSPLSKENQGTVTPQWRDDNFLLLPVQASLGISFFPSSA